MTTALIISNAASLALAIGCWLGWGKALSLAEEANRGWRAALNGWFDALVLLHGEDQREALNRWREERGA